MLKFFSKIMDRSLSEGHLKKYESCKSGIIFRISMVSEELSSKSIL